MTSVPWYVFRHLNEVFDECTYIDWKCWSNFHKQLPWIIYRLNIFLNFQFDALFDSSCHLAVKSADNSTGTNYNKNTGELGSRGIIHNCQKCIYIYIIFFLGGGGCEKGYICFVLWHPSIMFYLNSFTVIKGRYILKLKYKLVIHP